MTIMNGQTLATDANLTELARLIHQLEDTLEPGPHSRTPRHLTDQQRRQERELIRREKADRVTLQRRGLPVIGYSRAPLVVSTLAALTIVHSGLCRVEALVYDRLAVVPWPMELDPSDVRRCERVRHRLHLLEDPFLSWVDQELARLLEVATLAADEDHQTPMDRPCPWCGRLDTLTVYHDRDYVRCNNPGCVCTVPDCGCRREGWRHLWRRAQWGVLATMIQGRLARDREAAA